MTMTRSPFGRTPTAPKGLTLRAAADATTEAELLLYDEIGYFGIGAKDVVQALQQVRAEVLHVRLNSPGGDVMDGVAIYNALRQWAAGGRQVVTHIDGMAASIASVIALAGDEVRMADNAFYMIHEPWAVTLGTAGDHRKTAEVLDKVEGVILDTYMKRAEADRAEVQQWMQAETWFTAQEALDAGFVDTLVEATPAKARFDLSVFRNAPTALREAAPARASERDLERLLRDAGCSRSEAKAAVAALKGPNSPRDAAEGGVTAQVGTDLLRHLKTLTQ